MPIELNAQKRTVLGKRTKKLREEGSVPAEVFGHGFENVHVSVGRKELEKAYAAAGENAIVTLAIEGDERIPVLISGVERDRLSGDPLAADFYHVRKDEKIRAHVPVVYEGVDAAGKEGYLLVKVLEHVEVEALPDAIPPSFTVNIADLAEPGQNREVRDLAAPQGVRILTPADTVIVTVTEKEKEEATVSPPAEAGAGAEDAAAETGEKKETEKNG